MFGYLIGWVKDREVMALTSLVQVCIVWLSYWLGQGQRSDGTDQLGTGMYCLVILLVGSMTEK